MLRGECSCGRHPGKDMVVFWGVRVVLWILLSPHEVGGLIMVLCYQGCFFWVLSKFVSLLAVPPPTSRPSGYPGQTVCFADNNREEINTENATACKATPLQLSLVRTPLLGDPLWVLCNSVKVSIFKPSFKYKLLKLYLLVFPFISLQVWLC